jgi:hypothetical protein
MSDIVLGESNIEELRNYFGDSVEVKNNTTIIGYPILKLAILIAGIERGLIIFTRDPDQSLLVSDPDHKLVIDPTSHTLIN